MRMYICTRFKKAMNKIWIPLLQESQKDKIIGLVVQLVRIPACHAGGRGFESRPDRNKVEPFTIKWRVFYFQAQKLAFEA